jgi:putative transposase
MAEEKQCVLVLISPDKSGLKEIIGLADGYRESIQSWRELLLDLQRRDLTHAPDLAIGYGALGFWHALCEVFGATKEQRCWLHKTGNVLNAMPKSVQAKAKGHLHDIWQAETRMDAEAAFDFFVATYGVKYDKAVAKLTKDRDVLLAFYDFPAEHWTHIRTTNPIESTFATVQHRTGKTKGCLSRKTRLAMAFKLMMSAQVKWRKLDGANRMPEIIQGIEFNDGIKQLQNAA